MAYCLIDKSNFFYNLSKIEEKVDKNKIGLVIKNNAYGHGLLEIASLANKYGVKNVIVNNLNEAIKVSNLFETILVLQDIPNKRINNNIIITINSIDSINDIPAGTKVELKIDTGMHRNGIMPAEVDNALNLIKKNKLKLHGVFTHFADASSENNSIFKQKNKFDGIRKIILSDERFSDSNIRFHCSASSSLFRFDNNEYDLVRVGLMLYGYVALPDSYKKPNLKPVLSLWAEKISSKSIFKGDSVGYGKKYIAEDNMEVSTYDIGYGDGFMRLNEKKKGTIKDGQEILGVVSMNSFSLQGKDKEVCVFDNAEKFAQIHETIVYEIISNINSNLKRIIV